MTYNVFGGNLNFTQSNSLLQKAQYNVFHCHFCYSETVVNSG